MKNFKITLMLVVCLIIIMFSACSNANENTNNNKIYDCCKEYAKDYVIVETADEEKTTVKVNAPDFNEIIKIMSEDTNIDELNSIDLEKIINENPECTKEYVFSVDSIDDDEIEKKFLDQVSYELMIYAIENIECTDEWSAEE